MDVALVTGGSSGIGLAIYNELKKSGCKVYCAAKNTNIDLMTEEGLEKTKDLLPYCNIIINNVGGIGSNPKEWKLCMEKNYNIMVELTEEFLKTKRKWGRVVTISSIYGKEKGPNPGFAAAKSAQIAYMKSLAGKYPGTTFNVICPGHIDVGKPFPYKPKIIGKPEDVAYLVDFLCSTRANHINGAIITCDGGESHAF